MALQAGARGEGGGEREKFVLVMTFFSPFPYESFFFSRDVSIHDIFFIRVTCSVFGVNIPFGSGRVHDFFWYKYTGRMYLFLTQITPSPSNNVYSKKEKNESTALTISHPCAWFISLKNTGILLLRYFFSFCFYSFLT